MTVRDLGKLIVAKASKELPKAQKIAQSGHTASDTVQCKQTNETKRNKTKRTHWIFLFRPKMFSFFKSKFIPTSFFDEEDLTSELDLDSKDCVQTEVTDKVNFTQTEHLLFFI